MHSAAPWGLVLLAFIPACDDTARAVEETSRDDRARLEQKTEQAGRDLEQGARKATEAVKNAAVDIADAAAKAVDRADKNIADKVRANDDKHEEPRR